MSIQVLIVVGLLAGLLASKLIIRSGEGLLRDLALGVAGALAAGAVFRMLDTTEATGYHVFGLIVALAGACAMVVLYHSFFSPRSS